MDCNGFEHIHIAEHQQKTALRLREKMGHWSYQALLERLVREGLAKAINMLDVSEAERKEHEGCAS